MKRAISLEKTLKPLVEAFKTTLDAVSHGLDMYEGEEDVEDLKQQVQRGDLFVALLEQYFGFLCNQLSYASQRESLAENIEKLEKSLLALNIDGHRGTGSELGLPLSILWINMNNCPVITGH